MSILTSASSELQRSPITVIATVVGVVASTLAVSIAWFQYSGPIAIQATPAAVSSARLNISNLLIAFAFCLSSSLSFASAIRLLARTHWFAALAMSVPAAVLPAFGTMLVLYLAPPRALTPEAFATAQDVVFWGTAIIFIALNGFALLREVARSDPDEQKEPKSSEGTGFLVIVVLILMAWSGLVSAGLSKTVKAFLL
jgi:hypothetical protein